ncbi:MAG: hypothetical protein WDA24_06600 [Tissierellales bacterium]
MKTNKMHKLFMILGIGIGVVITSLLNMAYPKIQYEDYTESQIIEKARELGMVSLKEVITKNDEEIVETGLPDSDMDANIDLDIGTNTGTNIDSDNEIDEEPTTNEIDEDTTNEKTDKQIVEFIINKGDNSELIIKRLFDSNIIKNKKEFSDKVIEKDVQRKFKYGVYELELDMDYETLIKALTVR